jgi:hypothetical protein
VRASSSRQASTGRGSLCRVQVLDSGLLDIAGRGLCQHGVVSVRVESVTGTGSESLPVPVGASGPCRCFFKKFDAAVSRLAGWSNRGCRFCLWQIEYHRHAPASHATASGTQAVSASGSARPPAPESDPAASARRGRAPPGRGHSGCQWPGAAGANGRPAAGGAAVRQAVAACAIGTLANL